MPGVREAGWTEKSYQESMLGTEKSLAEQCQEVINTLVLHENSWPFRKPVNCEEVVDYKDKIKK